MPDRAPTHGATAPSPKPSGRHLPALDGVRGLAIAMVLLVHFVGDETPTSLAERVLVKLANYGVWGVDLFFVLSGFLITGILDDARTAPRYYRDFYVRRVLRIFPLYFGTLLILFGILPLLPVHYPAGLSEARRQQAWLWSYGSNFYIARAGTWALPYVSHFWSLAVEEHFYLFWPFVVRAFDHARLVAICMGCMAFALALRCALALAGEDDVTLTVLTPCRIDAFCVGALVAISARQAGVAATARTAARWMAPAASAIVIFSACNAATHGALAPLALPLRTTAVAVFFGALIARAVVADPAGLLGRALHSRVARTMGKYSYGVYVFHAIIAYGLQQRGTSFALGARLGSHLAAIAVQAGGGMAFSLLLAVASYELVEKHFLQLKARFAPRAALCVGVPPRLTQPVER